MGKYFGTDGYRAEAGVTLTAETAFRLGRILGIYYGGSGERPRVAIGKDTRRSSYMLEYAIASGLAASGADAYMLHVITTPGVAYVTRVEGFTLGIMISASHNPYTDNGIKLIGGEGEKIDDRAIAQIEEMMDSEEPLPSALGEHIGRIIDWYEGRNRYTGYLISLVRHSFSGLRIGLDLANGAAWNIGRAVFEALGARVTAIGNEPSGMNINRGVGSTHTEALCELVLREGLDMGFAFDGDADRCIAVDRDGREVNGDAILYALAKELRARGELEKNTVVTTVMSNLGLYRALDGAGIGYTQTDVGDRFIWERMKAEGYSLGGEQSGHIIVRKYSPTGDGILTALLLTEAVLDSGAALEELTSAVKMMPQVTVSVRVRNKSQAAKKAELREAVASTERALSGRGRVLLRESGTEEVLRVMVEAEDVATCKSYADTLAEIIRRGEVDCGE